MKKIIAVIIFLIFLALVGYFAVTAFAKEHKVYWCHCEYVKKDKEVQCQTLHIDESALKGHKKHEKDYAGKCEEPEPTPTPCEPTPTPVEPTPTDVPEPTPTEQPKEERGTSPAGAPVCVGEPVKVAPYYDWNSCVRTDSDTVSCTWGLNDPHAQRYGVYYGMSEGNLPWYAEVNGHETTNIVLNYVPAGHVWTKICSIGNCGDQVCGSIVDP